MSPSSSSSIRRIAASGLRTRSSCTTPALYTSQTAKISSIGAFKIPKVVNEPNVSVLSLFLVRSKIKRIGRALTN